MKYKKLNLLFFVRLFSMIIFILAIIFFSNNLKDYYEIEVKKVTEIQTKKVSTDIEKLNLEFAAREKISNFSTQIDYLILSIIIGIAIITFIDSKVKAENKRLDKLERNVN